MERPRLGPGEVLVRVRAAGLDPGVWHLMTGRPYLVRLMGFGLFAPKNRVRGRDFAGTVEAVGQNVREFAVGDAVFGIGEGTFAEYVVVTPERIAPKPARLSFEQAAAVPISGASALVALRDVGKLEAGQRVLIIGAAGGVGSHAVQLAKAFGAEVTGVCSTSKLELVKSLGADRVIDYTREDFSADQQKFDVILDTAGRRPIAQLRRALGAHGTLVIVGGEGGDRWLGGFQRNLAAPLLGIGSGQKIVGLMFEERKQELMALKELIDEGKLTPLIDSTYPLRDAPSAIRYLERGHARGKVVITLSG